jgi:hypothetical protein
MFMTPVAERGIIGRDLSIVQEFVALVWRWCYTLLEGMDRAHRPGAGRRT